MEELFAVKCKSMKNDNVNTKQIFWHNLSIFIYTAVVLGLAYYFDLENKFNKNISWFDFVLLSLATFRIIRLFTYDVITEHIRAYFGKFDSGYQKEISTLINCPWCVSVWAGLFVTFIFFLHPLFYFFILALAVSGMGAFIQILIWKIGLEPWKIK